MDPATPAPTRPFVRFLSRGMVETFTAPDGTELTSAVRKSPVEGPVRVLATGIEGDGTTHAHDGRPRTRVHAFPWEHYPWFEARAGRALPMPTFGENLTIAGLAEGDVRVGDRVRIGTAVLRVTQPTSRCGILGRRLGIPEFLDWIQEGLRTGWYLDVEVEGEARAGDAVEALSRGPAHLLLSRLNAALHRTPGDEDLARSILAAPEIAEDWKGTVRRRFQRATGRPLADA